MSDTTTANVREKFVIEMEQNVPFDAIAETKYITSNDLCKMLSELFRGVFADFEGCIFEVPQAGQNLPASISLIFNHGKYDDGAVVACERISGKTTGNNVLDRTRNRDRQLQDGDRYYLTEDAKDALSSLLLPQFRGQNGQQPNWKNIVSEWSERTFQNYFNQGQLPQYTKVSFVDINALCRLLFGAKVDGDTVEYQAAIASAINNYGSMPNMQYTQNYMLGITKVSSKELMNVYEKLGFANVSSAVIR